MDSNWLMPAGSALRHPHSEGSRPSGTALMALVDQSDPAFLSIVGVLHEMRNAGVDLDESTVKAAVAMGRARHRPALQRTVVPTDAADEADDQSIVYYVRRADLVKIGTTTRPHMRFAALLPDEILAWEPGARPTERARHYQFDAWRLGGSEYFRINDALTRHVQQVRRLHGDPDPEWMTLDIVHSIGTRTIAPLRTPDSFVLVTVNEGAAALGIKRNAIDNWVRRRQLTPAGMDRGRPVYLLAHMNELAERSGLIPRASAA